MHTRGKNSTSSEQAPAQDSETPVNEDGKNDGAVDDKSSIRSESSHKSNRAPSVASETSPVLVSLNFLSPSTSLM